MSKHIDGLSDRLWVLVSSTGESMNSTGKGIGVSRMALSTWLNDETEPRAHNIVQICKYFNVSADWLLGLSDKKKPR